MSNILIGYPIYSDTGVTYTPTTSNKASWPSTQNIALNNLKDRRLHRIARSNTAALADTRCRIDLGVDRSVKVVAVPKHTISSSGKYRFLGVPSTMLFDYEAGDDISALSGTFTRVPTATVRAATYVDSAGRIQFAGENRCLQSQDFGTTWSATNVTVATNSVTAPDGTTTADTLTASNSNGTVLQSVTTTAVSWTFSVWMKRKTGSGAISIQVDGSTYVAKTLTTEWQRFSVTQTGAAGATSIGIKIATNTDAIYAWGAQAEIGSSAGPYLPTTSAMVGAPRDSHYTSIAGSRSLLLEDARTNLVLQAENFGTTWAAVGSPTRSAAAKACGVVSMDLIGDDDAAALEGYTQTITFTADAIKAVSFLIAQGSSTSTMIRLRDTSAGADRLLAAVTWSAGLPVITMTTGTSLGYTTLVDATGGSVFRVWLKTASVTAANTNSLQIYPASDAALATASTGTVYAGGVQAEDALAPSSYIPTTTATVARAVDVDSTTFSAVPQAMTIYVKIVDRGNANSGGNRGVLSIGSGAQPSVQLYADGAGHYTLFHHNGSASVTRTSVAATTYGDTIELRAVLQSDGSLILGQSINGAAEVSTAASGTNALAGAWAATTIWLGSLFNGAGFIGYQAIQSVRVSAGVQTLATMQAVVSDSGWLDAWPSGATAESVEGMNLPLVYVPTSGFTGRYWSLQISDASNTAGYVDLGRMVVCGGIQPAVNFAYGAEISVEDLSTVEQSDGGVRYFYERPTRRHFACGFPKLTEAEANASLMDMQRIAGTHDQFYFVFNPADTTYMHRRSFLATMERCSPIVAVANAWTSGFEIIEEL